MDEQKQLLRFRFPLEGNVSRRNFLKMAASLGISVATLDTVFFSSQVAYAATPGLVGYWPLDNGSGSSATDTSGGNHNGTLHGNASWVTGKMGTALSFNGHSTTVDINHNVLTTSSSFSVAAWVQLSSLSNWATAVSQDGSNVSGFFLQYTSPSTGTDGGKFAFSLLSSDATTATPVRATSPFSPVTNTWYHLVGVYNAATLQSQLYVNGVLVATRTVSAAWNATGETVIGRAKFGGPVDYWPGLIDDV
ncbi:MAG: twin-arginine translocation signal domain-containing protein, partial [Ktedonobacteraceae bacterium]|nr:twin-arginine translocation signal domain-containing protein [Ktedonobacteraceae bacterium]